MEEIKKQILLINLANYNETVNNMNKFKLNDREINLFCDIMQQFAEKYHAEQLRIHDVVGQSEQLSFTDDTMPPMGSKEFDCYHGFCKCKQDCKA